MVLRNETSIIRIVADVGADRWQQQCNVLPVEVFCWRARVRASSFFAWSGG